MAGVQHSAVEGLDGVRARFLPDAVLPVFLEPDDRGLADDVDQAVVWFDRHRDRVDRLVTEAGAVVLRGFALHTTADFGQLVDSYPSSEFGYTAGATPRKAVEGRVFEATRAPAQHKLKLHQEMAYLPHHPSRLAFYCLTAPETGGETIIGDMRRFDRNVPAEFRARVKECGVRYTRNFRSPDWSSGNRVLDTYHRPWTEAFGTEDRGKAEAACLEMGLDLEWVGDSISVIYTAPGFVTHPQTGREIWFNQIATQSLTVENVGAERLGLYDAQYGDHPRPYDTRYGDGTAIAVEDVSSLYPRLDEVTVAFPWQHGDVMFVDNFHTAHGRNAYTGERDVQVALLG